MTHSGHAPRDANRVPTLIGVDSNGLTATVPVAVDAATNRLLVQATIGAIGSLSNNNAAPGSTNIGALTAIANAAAVSYSEGNQVLLSTDLAGALRVTGSLSVGGTTDNSAYTAGSSTGTPTMGFYHSTIDSVTDGRAAAVAITPKRAMMVNLQTAAGAETGVSGLPLQVSLANTGANSNKLLVTADPITFASAQSVNATLTAETTKVIGTVNVAASQTIAVTNTGTFAVQASLAAETTKAIGVTRTADGSGNLLTSTTNALDVNLKTSSITLPVSGTVTANPTTPTVVQYAQATIAVTNTAVQLASKAVAGVIVQALSGNAGSVYIGDASVTSSNGFELQAGQATSVAIDNTNRLYVNGTSGDKVCYIGS